MTREFAKVSKIPKRPKIVIIFIQKISYKNTKIEFWPKEYQKNIYSGKFKALVWFSQNGYVCLKHYFRFSVGFCLPSKKTRFLAADVNLYKIILLYGKNHIN